MNRIPSQTTDRYWLVVIYTDYIFKKEKAQRASGKWLIFGSIEEIDELWLKIKTATLSGQLGPSTKVSTAKPNKNAADNNTRVICVFTEDFHNTEDVSRIETALRALGIKQKMVYKLDAHVGKYGHQGDNNLIQLISKAIS